MNDDQNLLASIERCEAARDGYEYHSENWKFYNRDLERMREELAKRNEDNRYSFRGPW